MFMRNPGCGLLEVITLMLYIAQVLRNLACTSLTMFIELSPSIDPSKNLAKLFSCMCLRLVSCCHVLDWKLLYSILGLY